MAEETEEQARTRILTQGSRDIKDEHIRSGRFTQDDDGQPVCDNCGARGWVTVVPGGALKSTKQLCNNCVRYAL